MRLSGSDREYELHQWANDWLSLDAAEGFEKNGRDDKGNMAPGIVSPARAVLNRAEIDQLRADMLEAQDAWREGNVHRTGTFWHEWALIVSQDGSIGFLEAI